MTRVAFLAWVLISLSACKGAEERAPRAVEPLGARTGHGFLYETAEGVREYALLAGIRGADTDNSRNALQALLDEAGPGLTLVETEAGRDRYDRPVVTAMFNRGEATIGLDAEMVQSGQAIAWPRPNADEGAELLLALEEEARSSMLGGWGDGQLAVRSPDPDPLAQHLDSAQIIEGRVVAIGEARNGRLYLNFGMNWRTDFTVSLNRDDRERFETQGLYDPATLEGADIRVRGWLYAENGPMIRVQSPWQIEVLDAPEPAALP